MLRGGLLRVPNEYQFRVSVTCDARLHAPRVRAGIYDAVYKLLCSGPVGIGLEVATLLVVAADSCPSCHHSAHHDRVCGFRPGLNLPACLCTAMDFEYQTPPKSARWSLTGPNAFWRERPPYVVVLLWGAVGWLFLAHKLLKP